MDARGQRADGARCQVLPVYTWHAGHLSVLLKAEYIYSAQRFAEVPRLTAAQVEALELFRRITEEPGMALALELGPGTCCSPAITPSCTGERSSRIPRSRRDGATCCASG